MILIKNASELNRYVTAQKEKGRTIGFIPTMGALHQGHQSLISASVEENDLTICSIFVNPAQFNDPKDFEKYPVTIEKDIALLESAGCQVLFLPSVHEIYPDGTDLSVQYDLGHLETVLEGKYRPGHFRGVCMVVHRLLQIVSPGHLYLGQKDYQQCMVIKKLLSITGMQDAVNIHICPTLREHGGLAMSSRNMRLTEQQRSTACVIFNALKNIKENLQAGDLNGLTERAAGMLTEKGLRPDYVSIADSSSLKLLTYWDGNRKLVALVAAYMDEVRLIDNMVLN